MPPASRAGHAQVRGERGPREEVPPDATWREGRERCTRHRASRPVADLSYRPESAHGIRRGRTGRGRPAMREEGGARSWEGGGRCVGREGPAPR